jgi:hypothetical protein
MTAQTYTDDRTVSSEQLAFSPGNWSVDQDEDPSSYHSLYTSKQIRFIRLRLLDGGVKQVQEP